MYNPYDLLQLLVNGQELTGRPIEFDSEVANQQTMTNGLGNPVKPTKISTVCPTCGQGLEIDVTLPEPPFPVLEVTCYHCNPEAPPSADPFMNPINDGRIPGHDIDPLLHDPSEQVVKDDDDDESSVADRLGDLIGDDVDLNPGPSDAPEVESDLPLETSGGPAEVHKDPVKGPEDTEKAPEGDPPSESEEEPEAQEKPKKATKKAAKKKTAKKAPKKAKKKPAKKKVAVEPADGLTEEVEFDEDELAEQE